jgi:predicted ATPase/class 3 adenylate cyclase
VSEPAVERRPLPSGTVTFLFTDIEGSTERWEQHREAMRDAVRQHEEIVQAAIAAHDGYVFKTIGDAFCATFRTAPDAIAAALEAQRALVNADFGNVGGLKVRMAVHTGLSYERSGDYFGPTVNRVSRLLSIGHGGQVLVSGTSTDLAQGDMPPKSSLRDLGAHRLRDLIQPEQVYQLVSPDLPSEFPPLRSLEALPNNLPLQLSELVGREADVNEVEKRLAKARIMTLVGTGGVGKTRLALQVGANLLDSYPGGVWFVELAPLTDPSFVAGAIAAVLDVKGPEDKPLIELLVRSLRHKQALIILDNCEHLVSGAADAADRLLHGCPGIRILATSRVGLNIEGETVVRVASLGVPKRADELTVQDAKLFGAIALFEERASAALESFTLDENNTAVVAQICRRLDGIPLAIELAAARVKVLSVQQLAARLDERFRILTGGRRNVLPRQQTMRALIDWSYDLLTENEKAIFRRVAVFAGGWTLDAASEVCADEQIEPWDVLDLLSALVDKSMVVAELSGAEQRYRLLESTRQYAWEKLAESGERDRVGARHARFFEAFGQQHYAATSKMSVRAWNALMEPELDNFRAALNWTLAEKHDLALGADVASVSAPLFSRLNLNNEGSRWVDLARETAEGVPMLTQGRLARWSAVLGQFQGRGFDQRQSKFKLAVELFRSTGEKSELGLTLMTWAWELAVVDRLDEARPLNEEALHIAREVNEESAIARCLSQAAYLAADPKAQDRLFEESLAMYRSLGDEDRIAVTLVWRAEAAFVRGEYDQCIKHGAAALEIDERAKDKAQISIDLSNLANYHLAAGNQALALDFARKALRAARENEATTGTIMTLVCVGGLACWCAMGDDVERGARLLGYCAAALDARGERRQPTEQINFDRAQERLREVLGARLDELLAAGASMAEERAIDEAMRV